MKKLILFSAICFATAVNSQNGATIEYKISSSKGPGGSMKINYSEFGSSSEFNMVIPQMPGGGMVTKGLIQKSNPDVTYMINDKNRSYSENKKSDAPAKEDNRTYEVKKLGEEKINGYKCVHALITEGKESHEVWNTKDIVDFAKYSEAFASDKKMSSGKRDKALKDAGCDGLPVKVVHKGNEKEGEKTMELVKVEKKTWSKSDFEIPAGYTKNESGTNPAGGTSGVKSQQEIMNMSPEERAKYIEELKKQYGK
jgi:hypothetical protein